MPALPAPPATRPGDPGEAWARGEPHATASLIQAQKLEAIGLLAAGVAHEINTPVQYVSDNVAYVATGFDAARRVIEALVAAARAGEPLSVPAAALAELEAYLVEVPRALAESAEGLGRVSAMVAALRNFSHPSRGVRGPFDLNQHLAMAITLARNEWRYVADVTTELDARLPPVVGIRDELAQAFLNLIVNAAHAIEAVTQHGRLGRGRITVTTRHVADQVVVAIADTGAGIPEPIRARVFEPFFTTKPVGRGTGLGLALVRAVVVDKHGGQIRFDVGPHGGTTFIVTLPIGRGDAAP